VPAVLMCATLQTLRLKCGSESRVDTEFMLTPARWKDNAGSLLSHLGPREKVTENWCAPGHVYRYSLI
jgi:hypothetical protein